MPRARLAWVVVIVVAVVLVASLMAAQVRFDQMAGEDSNSVDLSSFEISISQDSGVTYARYGTNGTVLSQSSDSSNVIRKALDALAGGGELHIGPGTYPIKGEYMVPSNTLIEGEGPGTTILEGTEHALVMVRGVSNVTLSSFSMMGSVQLEILSSEEGTKDVRVTSVTATVDEKSSAAFLVGAYGEGTVSGIIFTDCRALDCHTYGFLNTGDEGRYITNISYTGCEASRCGLGGRPNDWVVGFDLAESVNINGMSVIGCTADSNWESGFHFEKYVDLIDVKLVDCSASYNGIYKENPKYGSGFLLWQDTTLIDCVATGNALAGYTIKGQSDTVHMINSVVLGSNIQNVALVFPAVIMICVFRGALLSWAVDRSLQSKPPKEEILLPHQDHD